MVMVMVKGLVECAVHVHRQVVISRQVAPPAVWGRKGSNCHRALTCFCVSQLLMPALAACAMRSCSKCASHKVKNSLVEERATGFTRTAKWHDCDQAALLL